MSFNPLFFFVRSLFSVNLSVIYKENANNRTWRNTYILMRKKYCKVYKIFECFYEDFLAKNVALFLLIIFCLDWFKCSYILVFNDIYVNCSWVATRWQQCSTHLYTKSTQNDTKQTIHRTTQQFGRVRAVPRLG